MTHFTIHTQETAPAAPLLDKSLKAFLNKLELSIISSCRLLAPYSAHWPTRLSQQRFRTQSKVRN